MSLHENRPASLTLQLQLSENFEPDEWDHLTRQLRNEIQDLNVESVELVKGNQIPAGAKTGEAISMGALAIAILPAFIPQVVTFLQSWVMRAEGRRITVKSQIGDRSIELEYAPKSMSQEDLLKLVDTLTNVMKSGEESPSSKQQS